MGATLDPDTLQGVLIFELEKIIKPQGKYLDKDDWLDNYHPHKPEIDPQVLDQILIENIGHLHGFELWIVDGKKIRGELDIDFTTGGNPGRYTYVPNNQLWLESQHDSSDLGAILLHEFIECYLMIKHSMSYDGAHNIANMFEWKLRTRIDTYDVYLTEINIIPTITQIADNAIELIESCIKKISESL